MKVKSVKLSEIYPYYDNPRDNTNAVEPTKESIRRFGFVKPILVDKAGVIIAGHTRYVAAYQLGMEYVPVVYSSMDDEMAKKYRPGLEEAGKPTHKFMTRNMMQIHGLHLADPVDFVLCWTKNGKDIGGTGAAIRCAWDHGIEVFNIYNPKEKEAFLDLLRGMDFMNKLSGANEGFSEMSKLLGEDDVAV
jgi:hypothetical protein